MSTRMKIRRRSGFSLVEILIYVGFVGMIMVAVTLLASTAFTIRSEIRAALILEENIRYAELRIADSVSESAGMTTPATGTSGSTLVLTMASSTQNPTTFALSSGTITIAQGTGTAVALTSNEITVSNLTFSRASSTTPIVRIVIAGGLRNAGPSYPTQTVTTTASVHR